MTFVASDKNPPYEDVSEINVQFSSRKYKKLLDLCNLDDDKNLGENQISQIFVNAIYKWLKGEWSLDELSCIGNKLWGERENKVDKLADALLAAGESTYYIRRIYPVKNNKEFGSFERWIVEIMKYYEAHKEQVVKKKS